VLLGATNTALASVEPLHDLPLRNQKSAASIASDDDVDDDNVVIRRNYSFLVLFSFEIAVGYFFK
jgi:hypothetical protein